ncbi:MAG TPA: DUF1707 domain-containing protein [Marmoricola sp.]|jgi:Flp pilus assembly protein TadB|nr:DUF1707 domain-containing protein [Marmoricola sp.]
MTTLGGFGTWADLRLSDRDRARARKRLIRERGRGRIDVEELEERLDVVVTARTQGDLAQVFADLTPVPSAFGSLPGRPFAGRAFRRRLRLPLGPLLLVAVVVAITGHLPWLVVGLFAAAIVLTAPLRLGRRWGHRARWAC